MTARNFPHVVVIGAGIIGAALAYYLTKAGARVTVIGARQARHGATGASFAWINATIGNPRHYFDLRVAAMAEWRRLEGEIGGLNIVWSGSLLWEGLSPEELDAFVREHGSWGYDIRRIEHDEIARLEPALRAPPPFAALASREGALDPLAAIDALLAAACSGGARLRTGVEVTDIVAEGGQVRGVTTTDGKLAADHVAVAAGTGTAQLLDPLGVDLPMDNRDGLLIHTKPLAPLVNHVLMGADFDLRQGADGRILAGSSFGGTPLDDAPERLAADLLERLGALLYAPEPLELERWTVGCRPMPADTFPAAGPVPGVEGLTVAVTHSGITLAPALGQFLAREIIEGVQEPLLSPFQPARFAG